MPHMSLQVSFQVLYSLYAYSNILKGGLLLAKPSSDTASEVALREKAWVTSSYPYDTQGPGPKANTYFAAGLLALPFSKSVQR